MCNPHDHIVIYKYTYQPTNGKVVIGHIPPYTLDYTTALNHSLMFTIGNIIIFLSIWPELNNYKIKYLNEWLKMFSYQYKFKNNCDQNL